MNQKSGPLLFEDTFSTASSQPGWQIGLPFDGLARNALPWNNEVCWYGNPPYRNVDKLYLMASPASALHSNPYSTPPGAFNAEIGRLLYLPVNTVAVHTKGSFGFLYGYAEARLRLAVGKGLWPGFWMFADDGVSKDEIDVMECIGNSHQYHVSTHLTPGGTTTQPIDTVPDLGIGYHDYGVDWTPDTLTFYFDGQPVHTQANPGLHRRMVLILSLAVGGKGSWPGPTDASTSWPAYFLVDSVRVWAADSAAGS